MSPETSSACAERQSLTYFSETSSIDGSTPTPSNHEAQHIDDEKRSIHDHLDVEKGPIPSDEETTQQDDIPRDPNIVDWDGPDDPENPLNWTAKRKVTATVSIALITFLTYVHYRPDFESVQ